MGFFHELNRLSWGIPIYGTPIALFGSSSPDAKAMWPTFRDSKATEFQRKPTKKTVRNWAGLDSCVDFGGVFGGATWGDISMWGQRSESVVDIPWYGPWQLKMLLDPMILLQPSSWWCGSSHQYGRSPCAVEGGRWNFRPFFGMVWSNYNHLTVMLLEWW